MKKVRISNIMTLIRSSYRNVSFYKIKNLCRTCLSQNFKMRYFRLFCSPNSKYYFFSLKILLSSGWALLNNIFLWWRHYKNTLNRNPDISDRGSQREDPYTIWRKNYLETYTLTLISFIDHSILNKHEETLSHKDTSTCDIKP